MFEREWSLVFCCGGGPDVVAVARKSAGFGAAFAAALAGVLAEAAPILDERARRVLAGAGARQLGRGGIKLVAAAIGASADTVGKGVAELEAGLVADGRVRAKGAGRPAAERRDPGVWAALDALVDPLTRGDPMSPLRWTTKSTVKLADALTQRGHRVGPKTVARLAATSSTSVPRRSVTPLWPPRCTTARKSRVDGGAGRASLRGHQ